MSFLRREIEARFRRIAPTSWWGDHLDVRFELVRRVRGLRGLRVLDVATAEGIILAEVPRSCVRVGLDRDPAFARQAAGNAPGARIVVGDMRALPFKREAFDVVLFAHTLEVTPDRTATVQELWRVLRPGGRLWLTTPNGAHPRYRGAGKLDLEELSDLFGPGLGSRIAGYNPLLWPTRGRGARPLSRLPGIDHLLRGLMRLPVRLVSPFVMSFFVEAERRPAPDPAPPARRRTEAALPGAGVFR
jgi:SAM-dependent methyltransferase